MSMMSIFSRKKEEKPFSKEDFLVSPEFAAIEEGIHKEYERKLSTIAMCLQEKSEEAEYLQKKMETLEKESRRKLEALANCLEEMAKENMKMAQRPVSASGSSFALHDPDLAEPALSVDGTAKELPAFPTDDSAQKKAQAREERREEYKLPSEPTLDDLPVVKVDSTPTLASDIKKSHSKPKLTPKVQKTVAPAPNTATPTKSITADDKDLNLDQASLATLLKKYKLQNEQLRRVRNDMNSRKLILQDLIRSQQKQESAAQSIEKYEEKLTKVEKTFKESLQKEAKRRKDAEYIATAMKKRVTELQFLLDEKDDSDESSEESD